MSPVFPHLRDPAQMLRHTLSQHDPKTDLWLFGYASLIWRPDFDYQEKRAARLHGWHRALKMWSRINRGSAQQPGLVFALLSGGSCHGVVFRIAQQQIGEVMTRLWEREMPTGVYDPRWLRCHTDSGAVTALAFTLSRQSPNFTGELSAAQYRHIFRHARGRYGSTQDYAHQTYESLKAHGVHDRALARLLAHAKAGGHA
ncbi:MAG: gamma-glutamylcyclotransferase [Hylemonella sp.]|nr:gamma-glutamylcyclotransferase [Hylemonella sp.]